MLFRVPELREAQVSPLDLLSLSITYEKQGEVIHKAAIRYGNVMPRDRGDLMGSDSSLSVMTSI